MMYGLIGEKLGHSYSKIIHEKLSTFEYQLQELQKQELPQCLTQKNFLGINVTIPYKEMVIPYLDEIDEKAKRIGSVNTVIHKDGKLCGYNTDYDGFLYMLQKHHVSVTDSKVLILGSGGTSKTASCVMKDLSAREIIIASRTASSNTISYQELSNHHDVDIIVNTTPLGMYPLIEAQAIDLSLFANCHTVIDVIYNPFQTRLLQQANELEKKVIGGLEMLIAQAVYANEKFHSTKHDPHIIDTLYHSIKKDLLNIVLIGMPGSGKSSIAKQLSSLLGKTLIDTDEVVVSTYQQSIKEMFEEHGELYFREKECEVVALFAGKNNQIISTGGGVILSKRNMQNLRSNGIVIFIERDVNELSIDANRPLSTCLSDNELLYRKRYPYYKQYSDIAIKNDQGIDQVVTKIKEYYDEITSD